MYLCFFTDNFRVCDKCLIRVNRATLHKCVRSCSRVLDFFGSYCEIHNEKKTFGNFCAKCTINATLSLVDFNKIEDNYIEKEKILIISNGEILLDVYKLYRKGEKNEYTHLLEGGRKVQCGGGDYETEIQPENIIKAITENMCEVKFTIKPPSNGIYPTPYLNENIEGIMSGINSSNKIDINKSHKVNISTFSKYYKKKHF